MISIITLMLCFIFYNFYVLLELKNKIRVLESKEEARRCAAIRQRLRDGGNDV